jgi:hypothetical protein
MSQLLSRKTQTNDSSPSTLSRKDMTADQVLQSMTTAERAKTFHRDGVLGCKHYPRGCKYLSDCCDKIVTCRLCHDEASDHVMPRRDTKLMYCMSCEKVQVKNYVHSSPLTVRRCFLSQQTHF